MADHHVPTGHAGYATPGPAVITPEAVGLELPVATVGSRGVAWLVDILAIGLGFLVLGTATAIFGGGGFIPDWAGVALLLLLVFALQFGYPIAFETALRGRTPGKAALGLRVVTVEGAPIGLRHAVIRALLAVVELLGTLGAPAVISSLVSRRGQRLGDLAAGTMVVRERRMGGAPRAMSFVAPPGLEAHTAQLDTSRISAETYATIRETLRRAPGLPAETRLRITTRLATVVAAEVSPAPPQGVPPEPWLWCVAAAVQTRHRPVGVAEPRAGAGPSRAPLPGAPPWPTGQHARPAATTRPPTQEPVSTWRREGTDFAPPA